MSESTKVSVRELKNHLSEFLRKVQAGEEIVITSRGKAVAVLSQVAAAHTRESDAELIDRLESQPWIIPARKRGKPRGASRPVRIPDGTTDELVNWVRGG